MAKQVEHLGPAELAKLKKAKLRYAQYGSNVCNFCGDTTANYFATGDYTIRICPVCFEQFKDKFEWEEQDWRLGRGQEKYLKGAKLKYVTDFKKFSDTWDHEHCEFCMDKFMEAEGCLREGYCTLDEKNWICQTCFDDFKEMFKWTVVDRES